MFKEDTKKIYRNSDMKNTDAREPPFMAEVEPCWKSLWGEKAIAYERAEWIRRRERRKISSMDWVSIKTMEITSFLSKAPNCKSPGSDKIPNYWLQAFLAAYQHFTEYFKAILEEPEKVPEWLTIGIRRQQGSQKLPTYIMLDNHVQDPNRHNSQKNLHTSEEQNLLPADQKV
jgi:hypothetical protein